MALLDSLDVPAGVVRKVDLVEDLPIGRRELTVGVRIAAVERVSQAAESARVALGIDRRARDAVGDPGTLERMEEEAKGVS